ncbi:MAG TPA: rod shape-determining protein MreC [Acidimicrobiia bacterium]|jgi:rod shape-determining protein MreC
MRTAGGRTASLLVVLSLTLAAADHAGVAAPAVDGVRASVRGGLAQLEAAATRPVSAVATALGRADDLARENARLRQAASEDRGRAQWADALARDNAQLASLTGLSAPGGVPQIPTRVVALPGGRPGSGLVLDRGSEAGIEPGMPVVAGGVLVGRVLTASAGRAAVLPVVDATSAVGVRLAGSGEVGVVEGSGRSLRLQLLNPGAEAADGDLVVTAGLQHGRFPPALPVGHVRRGGRHVAPLAALSRLEVVEVLAWRPPA